MIAEKQALS